MEALAFRPATRADFPALSRWIGAPHVARWWMRPSDPASIEERYGPCIDGREPTEMFILEADRVPIGMMLRYLTADYPSWAAAVGLTDVVGIDYLIGDARYVGKGIGSRAIRAFAELALARYPMTVGVVAAPQQQNVASWKALENAGFVRHWAGELASDDPADEGPSYVYVRWRGETPAGPQ